MDQNLFNIIVSVTGVFGGWILKTIWDAVKELQQSDKELTDRIHELDKVVAGDYVRRDYLDAKITALLAKLDALTEVIHKKADK